MVPMVEVLDPMVLGSRVCPVQVCEPCSDPVGCAEDPCALFDKVPFPAQAFTPTGCDKPGDCYQTL